MMTKAAIGKVDNRRYNIATSSANVVTSTERLLGSSWSITSRSRENRLKILPSGVVSKNIIGAWITRWQMFLCTESATVTALIAIERLMAKIPTTANEKNMNQIPTAVL